LPNRGESREKETIRKLRYEKNPDWTREFERELNAAIGEVVKQVAADLPGHEVDEILTTLRARLSTVLPEEAFNQKALADHLRQDAERISNFRQTPGIRT
jgi:hypothetical protein